MKCPNCGYFNLPGTQICGRCSRSLAETDPSDAASSDEWLPPRASNRTARQKFDGAVSPFTRRAVISAENTADNVIHTIRQLPQDAQQAREEFNESARTQIERTQIYRQFTQPQETWTDFTIRAGLVLFSIIPGFSQMIGQRYLRSFILSTAWILNALAFYLTIKNPLSDAFLWAFGAIHVASIFENLSYGTNWNSARASLRGFRYGFLSLGYVAVVATIILFNLQTYFTPYNYYGGVNMGTPVVEIGDSLIFQDFEGSRIRRGDLLLQEDFQIDLDYPDGYGPNYAIDNALWKIVGLPDDVVTSKSGILFVNGKALPPKSLPASFKVPDGISQRVPKGELAVCGVLYGYQAGGIIPNAPFRTLPFSKFQRRVYAIIGPPERRQLFR